MDNQFNTKEILSVAALSMAVTIKAQAKELSFNIIKKSPQQIERKFGKFNTSAFNIKVNLNPFNADDPQQDGNSYKNTSDSPDRNTENLLMGNPRL